MVGVLLLLMVLLLFVAMMITMMHSDEELLSIAFQVKLFMRPLCSACFRFADYTPSRKSRIKSKGHRQRRQFGTYTRTDLRAYDPCDPYDPYKLQLDHDCFSKDDTSSLLEGTASSQEFVTVLDWSKMFRVGSKKKNKKMKKKPNERTANLRVTHLTKASGVATGFCDKGLAIWTDPPEADTRIETQADSVSDSASSDIFLSSSSPSSSFAPTPVEETQLPTKSSICTSSARPASLQGVFGKRYREGRCVPRRFAIHLSGDMREASYLLFQLDGTHSDDGSETARYLNQLDYTDLYYSLRSVYIIKLQNPPSLPPKKNFVVNKLY